MGHNFILFFHLLGVSVFGGFIILDRLVFRKFFEERAIDSALFYIKSFRILVFSAILIIFSGAAIIYSKPHLLNQDIFILKLFLAFLLFTLFFNCPLFLKNMGKPARNIYRFFVLVLLINVFATALFIT